MSSQEPAETLPVVKAEAGQITAIRQQISIDDRAAISTFGDQAQRSVTSYADRILGQVANKELGNTGQLLTDIILQAKGLDPASIQNAGFFTRMFSSARARLEKFKARFEDVASQIDRISLQLDRHKDTLRRDIAMLDDLHDETRESIINLDAFIEAGKAFAEQFRSTELPRLKAVADAAPKNADGVLEAQVFQDAVQALDRLEKRVYYLQQARMLGIQQLPQIRIIQSGDETLIENLQATATLTIPAWKQKMVVLLGLSRQKEALDLQRAVTDATNKMIREASEMMKEQAIAVEEQAQRGIVDIETLAAANQDLIDTVNGVLRVQEDGRRKRADAERRMEQMTADLRRGLSEAQASIGQAR